MKIPADMPYYVSGQGSDGYTAAQAQNTATPWQTIRKGMITAPAGGEVQIRGGTYPSVNVVGDDLTKAAEFVVKPFPGEAVTVQGGNVGVMNRVTFDGLRFTNTLVFGTESPAREVNNTKLRGCDLDMQHVDGRDALWLIWVKDRFTVEDSIIQNCDKVNLSEQGGRGIYIGGSQASPLTNLQILRTDFLNIQEDGIEHATRSIDTLVEDCLLDNVSSLIPNSDGHAHSDAISVDGSSVGFTLRRTKIVNGYRGVIFLGSYDPEHGHDAAVIEGNEIAQSGFQETSGAGFGLLGYSMRNPRIVNNTIWPVANAHGSGSGGFVELYYQWSASEALKTTGAVFKNNIVKRLIVNNNGGTVTFAEREYNLYGQAPAHTLGTGEIVGTPTFEDEAGHDLHLAAGSLGIDTGEPAPTDAPQIDIDSNARPAGTRVDIGAYEFDSAPTLSVADSVTTTDAVAKAAAKTQFDTVGVEDALAKAFAKSRTEVALLADDVLVAETDADELPVTVADSVTVSDSVAKQTGKGLVE